MTGGFDAATINRTGIFTNLTRPELDQLLLTAEQAYLRAETRLMQITLTDDSAPALEDAAGVAADCWWMWDQAEMQSIWDLWHGPESRAWRTRAWGGR